MKLLFEVQRWIDPNIKFKRLNNKYTPYYARLFLEEYPEYKGFFEIRKIRKD